MSSTINRRTFIQTTTAASLGLGVAGSLRPLMGQVAPSDTIVVAVMGTNGRGSQLAKVMARLEGVEVAYICDPDENAVAKGLKSVNDVVSKEPKGIADFRNALEDPNVDALVIAAPDHWHAPAAIMACKAGKHVYVEKPCGHNAMEGELLVQAARKYNRVVQMGNQRRSWPNIIKGMNALHEGIIGRVYFAKGWYANTRGSIGYGKPAPVPANLDYELWQGPAPRRPYMDNLIHYNWHWFWHYGTAETCNNGTHEIDVMRWGLGVDFPTRVTSAGGRYHWKDDWEMPDTQVLSFDFPGDVSMMWEGRSCNGRPVEGQGRGCRFHGENGSMVIEGNGYTVFDYKSNVVETVKDNVEDRSAGDITGPGDRLDAYHLLNFVESIRNGTTPNSEIEVGHRSVLLCHLGNIAHRTGRVIHCDQRNGHVIGDKEAMGYWGRSYEPGWEVTV